MKGNAPERILIVDDERAITELMRRLLEQGGYVCATAASGEEADDRLASGPFHLMLADLQLPGESGLDLIGRVRHAHPDTAAIMVTGTDDPQLADTALKIGAYGYIVKPFSPTELSIQARNALRRRKRAIEQRDERRQLEQTVEAVELHLAVEQLERSQEETALTSDRPCRGALGRLEALELLEEGRGTQFDPAALDAFLAALADSPDVQSRMEIHL